MRHRVEREGGAAVRSPAVALLPTDLSSMPMTDFPRLPPGRHNLPRDFVRSYQRRRIVAAMIEIVDRDGPISLPVTKIIKAAGISRHTFYEFFADSDECFGVACGEAFDFLFEPFHEDFAAPGSGVERLDFALRALLARMAEEPILGRLCLVHAAARRSDGGTRHRAVEAIAAALGEAEGRAGPSLQRELLAGGAVALIAQRLVNGGIDDLEVLLTPQLTRLFAPAPAALEDEGESDRLAAPA
jgi:AcrR family transcriptional regulator